MLVLSRKVNEVVCIGPMIEVRVLAVRGEQVKLGFVGPSNVAIHREEVYQRIRGRASQLTRV